jgi:hypothetical protein
MSHTERRRQSKQVKTLCLGCQERKARFRYRGEVRADRDHSLCFECYRGEVNRARARRLGRVALDPRKIAHRQRMLEHLSDWGDRVVTGGVDGPIR